MSWKLSARQYNDLMEKSPSQISNALMHSQKTYSLPFEGGVGWVPIREVCGFSEQHFTYFFTLNDALVNPFEKVLTELLNHLKYL